MYQYMYQYMYMYMYMYMIHCMVVENLHCLAAKGINHLKIGVPTPRKMQLASIFVGLPHLPHT